MNSKNKIRLIIALALVVPLSLYIASCSPPFMSHTTDWHFEFSFPYWGFPFGILGLALYFLPTIIAAIRRSKSLLGIVLVNVLLGWTMVGWIISLVWSLVGEAGRR